MSIYIKNTERSQINKLMLHIKPLEKQEWAKPKTSRREIIKNKGQNHWNREKQNKTKQKHTKNQQNKKSRFFQKINKSENLLANMTKMRKEKIQTSKIRNAKGTQQ
jgi:hypothetical protein